MTAFELAQRFVGVKEIPGTTSSSLVLAMLQLDDPWPKDDAVPWCSAFVNFICWLLRLPRSKSLAARSWLGVGQPIPLVDAEVGFDIVVFSRGTTGGHVGFFAGKAEGMVFVLGGNQGDKVCVEPFNDSRVLGVRRLSLS